MNTSLTMRHNTLWQGEATMVVSLFVFGRKQVIIGAKMILGAKTEVTVFRWCNSSAKSWRQTNCNQANAV